MTVSISVFGQLDAFKRVELPKVRSDVSGIGDRFDHSEVIGKDEER